MTETQAPTYSGRVDQSFFIAPLGGPQNPNSLLDRFPDEVYDKTESSHFVRFMYALLGPAGVGWLSKNYLDARLKLYQHGFSTFDIEKFYGDPFRFGRILSEQFTTDPSGLLPREEWDKIKAQDEAYRSRSITFFNAARLGGTVQGLQMAAQSGVNHAVEIVENYRYLFDLHTDVPLGLPYYGKTMTTEEFIIIPRREDSRSEVQTLDFEDTTIVGGSVHLSFRGRGTSIPWDANNIEVEEALTAVSTVGDGNVSVTGGPCPNPLVIRFTGLLSNQDVPELEVTSSLVDNNATPKGAYITTTTGGVQPTDEIVQIDPLLEHNLQTAIDLLRPVPTLPTFSPGSGLRNRLFWKSIHSSSAYTEVIRFVTGNPEREWPELDPVNWVESNVEKESQKIQGDLQHHYTGFYTASGITAYTDEALDDVNYEVETSVLSQYDSTHVGLFDPNHAALYKQLQQTTDPTYVFAAADALHPTPDTPLVLTREDNTLDPLIGGTITTGVIGKDGWKIDYKDTRQWSSLERKPPATDYLEIDLGASRLVNYVEFNIRVKPLYIDIFYDKRDDPPKRDFAHVEEWPGKKYATHVAYGPSNQGEMEAMKIFFKAPRDKFVVTRFIRIAFRRPDLNALRYLDSGSSALFYDPLTKLNPIPYSVDIKHLKLGQYGQAVGGDGWTEERMTGGAV